MLRGKEKAEWLTGIGAIGGDVEERLHQASGHNLESDSSGAVVVRTAIRVVVLSRLQVVQHIRDVDAISVGRGRGIGAGGAVLEQARALKQTLCSNSYKKRCLKVRKKPTDDSLK